MRRPMITILVLCWMLAAGVGMLVFLGALRRAHASDELMGSHDMGAAELILPAR